jgi:hypothetical protein
MHRKRPRDAQGTDARERGADRSLRLVRILAVVFAGTWVLALAAAVLGATGVLALLASSGKLVFFVGLVAMFVVRGPGTWQPVGH